MEDNLLTKFGIGAIVILCAGFLYFKVAKCDFKLESPEKINFEYTTPKHNQFKKEVIIGLAALNAAIGIANLIKGRRPKTEPKKEDPKKPVVQTQNKQ